MIKEPNSNVAKDQGGINVPVGFIANIDNIYKTTYIQL